VHQIDIDKGDNSTLGQSKDVTIELENRLPASLADLDESYKDDIISRDTTRANPPVRTPALLPRGGLLRSQSEERCQENIDELTLRNRYTRRATRFANIPREIVFCACV
jgi:hypothetical protein